MEEWEDFIDIAWAVWNSRNKYILKFLSLDLVRICEHALKFVHYFEQCNEKILGDTVSYQRQWSPPSSGSLKMNFDGAILGQWGYGWGVVAEGEVAMCCLPACVKG